MGHPKVTLAVYSDKDTAGRLLYELNATLYSRVQFNMHT